MITDEQRELLRGADLFHRRQHRGVKVDDDRSRILELQYRIDRLERTVNKLMKLEHQG